MTEGLQKKHKIFIKRENGKNFWNDMHSMAAYYPENPDETQIKHMDFFLKTCGDYFLIEQSWADTFNKNIKDFPPKLDSRDSFIMWMCQQHNLVNDSIGKPLFSCTVPNLIKRWGPVTLPPTDHNEAKIA